MIRTFCLLAFVLFIGNTNVNAQNLEVVNSSSVVVDELPEYIVITSENTKLFGGINILIDYKKSAYKESLKKLEYLLQDGDKLKIRNQTDLLNALSKLGYEYVNAYSAESIGYGSTTGSAKARINMVFRKKESFRG